MPTSPEAEEGSCWDQEADLVLCGDIGDSSNDDSNNEDNISKQQT